jgi:hypothetical protein
MHGTLQDALAEQRKIERTLMQGTARMCSWPNFGKAWKGIHPYKSAETLAALTGQAVRTCAYEIAGERLPDARSVAALITESLKKVEGK